MLVFLFMSLLFATTIISAIIYQQTSHEIHLMLSICTGIIFLVWGLAVAHWSIHLIALLAILGVRIPDFRTKTIKVKN